MGALLYKMFAKTGVDKITNDIPKSLWDLEAKDIKGVMRKLGEYQKDNKAFVFVNVACKWGLTGEHYTQLVELHKKLSSKGLVILGFPCSQFKNQELDSEEEIDEYIKKNFDVEFPMFSKIEVNGESTHPIFKYLKNNTSQLKLETGLKNIPWNFGKFLVNSKGEVVGFYDPRVKPLDMQSAIEKLLI